MTGTVQAKITFANEEEYRRFLEVMDTIAEEQQLEEVFTIERIEGGAA